MTDGIDISAEKSRPTPARASDHLQFANRIVAAVSEVLGRHDGMVVLHEPMFEGREWEYVKDCLDTGWVSSVGAYVDRFEHDLAAYTGVKHAIATSNGTAALHISLIVAGVRPRDEVLIPTLTFIATANAVSYVGATPHFVDSEPVSLGIDAERLDAYLRHNAAVIDGVCTNRTTGCTISAVMPMHVFGHPCDLQALHALAARWKLSLIEDAAESLGSTYHGRHTGNVGVVSALSFNGNKVVTTGGGGAVLTNDVALARRAKHLTTTARVPHHWSFIHDEVGFNYRLPNINAALGCAQLERLAEMLAQKRRLADRYAAAFGSVPGVRVLREPPNSRGNYWLNAILLDEPDVDRRDAVLHALHAAKVMARPVWTLMHRLPMYAACPRMDLSVSEALDARIVNLPSSAKLGA